MNKKLDSNEVAENLLETTFDALWPTFENKVRNALSLVPPQVVEERKEKDVLNDILEIVLTLNRRLTAQSRSRTSKYMSPQHACLLIEKLTEVNLDRDEIVEITEALIPPHWLRNRLRKHFENGSDEIEPTEEDA